MVLYPKDILKQLEFDKLLVLLSRHAFGQKAKDELLNLSPTNAIDKIQLTLNQVEEYVLASERGEPIPMSSYENIDEDLYLLKKQGYVLSVESLFRIFQLLKISQSVYEYFNKADASLTINLKQLLSESPHLKSWINQFEKIFDDEGDIKPNASPGLAAVFSKIKSKSRELDQTFRQMLTKYKRAGYLTDSTESLRHGRRVLSVPTENKRKIKGIIHDESATGKTVFIEPEEVLEINNELFNLETEKKQEYYKILKSLCEELHPYTEDISSDYSTLLQLDKIQSRASFASEIGGQKPKLTNQPHLELYKAYHPLLLFKNSAIDEITVPFDLNLLNKNRILVLSGPNAGGKSITMKGVGLLQMMVQCGMLIPASAESKIGIFNQFFTDIGDQQSFEDDLSTYSSRLVNMKNVLEKADEKSLILIDEFGSGTDPKIGGAIAESILKEINHRKSWGVITTHYSNIKFFAYQTSGIVNGSMTFDTDSLRPNYQLKVGKPGSSFAFEIAQKSGIPNRVLKYAKYKTGKNQKSVEQLLVDLQSQQQSLKEQNQLLRNREKELQKLIDQYDNMYKDLEFKKRKFKMESKQKRLLKTNDEQKALQQLVKELKAKESLKKVQEVVKEKSLKQQDLLEEINELKEDIYFSEKVDESLLIEGSFAKLREGGTIGKIVSRKKNNLELSVGSITMRVKVRDVIPCSEPIERKPHKNINADLKQSTVKYENKIDVRGYVVSDAVAVVQEFMDMALINNVLDLTIVHGKGSGALRKAIRKKLKEYKAIKEVLHPKDDYGGEGVTIVKMA